MKVMVPEDMAVHKLVAFYERIGKTNRDIDDDWFMLKNNWSINQEMVEKRTQMPFKEFLETSRGVLEIIGNRSILSGMGELLSEKRKDWVRKNLKDELLFQIRLFLDAHS